MDFDTTWISYKKPNDESRISTRVAQFWKARIAGHVLIDRTWFNKLKFGGKKLTLPINFRYNQVIRFLLFIVGMFY